MIINPFMPYKISHHYQLDHSISVLRVAGSYFLHLIQIVLEHVVSK